MIEKRKFKRSLFIVMAISAVLAQLVSAQGSLLVNETASPPYR